MGTVGSARPTSWACCLYYTDTSISMMRDEGYLSGRKPYVESDAADRADLLCSQGREHAQNRLRVPSATSRREHGPARKSGGFDEKTFPECQPNINIGIRRFANEDGRWVRFRNEAHETCLASC